MLILGDFFIQKHHYLHEVTYIGEVKPKLLSLDLHYKSILALNLHKRLYLFDGLFFSFVFVFVLFLFVFCLFFVCLFVCWGVCLFVCLFVFYFVPTHLCLAFNNQKCFLDSLKFQIKDIFNRYALYPTVVWTKIFILDLANGFLISLSHQDLFIGGSSIVHFHADIDFFH